MAFRSCVGIQRTTPIWWPLPAHPCYTSWYLSVWLLINQPWATDKVSQRKWNCFLFQIFPMEMYRGRTFCFGLYRKLISKHSGQMHFIFLGAEYWAMEGRTWKIAITRSHSKLWAASNHQTPAQWPLYLANGWADDCCAFFLFCLLLL